ncbi:MAG TPA: PQQ-binding-like beta-propeller repeat protein [Verrucomicrobiae bacterium]|nr:PQQ-binding-like beta-propeller repeat protein [Verrucomicrobiae bacterium]
MLNQTAKAWFHWAGASGLWLLTASVSAGDWPAFRGPEGNGISRETRAPLHWSPDQNVRWKVPLPGPGNSSPIVSRGRVLITCAQDQGRKRHLFCFDRRTGEQRWVRTVEYGSVEPTHRTNPYGASTPVADGERVVVWHGSAGVFCYGLDGTEVWKKELGPARHEWGYASSPVIHRGLVLLNFGPGSRTFLAALDLKTGTLRWKHDEPGGLDATDQRMVGSWSTPIIATVAGRDQILCSMPTRVIALEPDRGTLLWFCGGLGSDKVDLVYASPVLSGEMGVAFTGWVTGPTIGFKLGGSGDVTSTNRLWLEKQTQRIGSGVAVDGYVYIVNAGPGTAQCIEGQTGKTRWTERLDGGESWGSVVMAAGRLYVTSRRGVTTAFRPNPDKFEQLAMNNLKEPSNATPAISDGEIFLRTDSHVFCITEE